MGINKQLINKSKLVLGIISSEYFNYRKNIS